MICTSTPILASQNRSALPKSCCSHWRIHEPESFPSTPHGTKCSAGHIDLPDLLCKETPLPPSALHSDEPAIQLKPANAAPASVSYTTPKPAGGRREHDPAVGTGGSYSSGCGEHSSGEDATPEGLLPSSIKNVGEPLAVPACSSHCRITLPGLCFMLGKESSEISCRH